MKRSYSTFAIIIVLISNLAIADDLYLKNGRVYHNVIITDTTVTQQARTSTGELAKAGQMEEAVTFDVIRSNGTIRTFTLQKSSILKIVYIEINKSIASYENDSGPAQLDLSSDASKGLSDNINVSTYYNPDGDVPFFDLDGSYFAEELSQDITTTTAGRSTTTNISASGKGYVTSAVIGIPMNKVTLFIGGGYGSNIRDGNNPNISTYNVGVKLRFYLHK